MNLPPANRLGEHRTERAINPPRALAGSVQNAPRVPRGNRLLAVPLAFCVACLCLFAQAHAGAPARLEGTAPLDPSEDRSAEMVAGIDRFASRAIDRARARRARAAADARAAGPRDEAEADRVRARLRRCIGAIDPRAGERGCETAAGAEFGEPMAEIDGTPVRRVRWAALDGVWGEGLWIEPRDGGRARAILLPDADQPPESLIGLAGEDGGCAARLIARLTRGGCAILIPTLVSRGCEFSGNTRLGRRAAVSHREWVYRQAYEMGRHIVGYEVSKVQAAIDWIDQTQGGGPGGRKLGVAGYGEGALVALLVGALDGRVSATLASGCFGPRDRMWEEPIERNLFGYLDGFGDAGVAALIAPRTLLIEACAAPPDPPAPEVAKGGRVIAAPGRLLAPTLAEVATEAAMARDWAGATGAGDWLQVIPAAAGNGFWRETVATAFARALGAQPGAGPDGSARALGPRVDGSGAILDRQRRQVRELEWFSQRLLNRVEADRNDTFWKGLPQDAPARFEAATAAHRARFWDEVIGRLPDPDRPAHARSRFLGLSGSVRLYEVTLDVWDDVFAWGWLCLPADARPGERRPVVVCQHGLEGLPADTVETDTAQRAHAAYKAFALRLAERGFVTFAPHNPYRGMDRFRVLQRKLNPLGKTLFSVIAGQHQRILEWLGAQRFCDPSRIGFYGLSYGGKSAMRLPALLPGYCLSICSGDFNDWVRKTTSVDAPLSYVYTGEYEIWEFGLGPSFNYAEMAALIAPRPFMVERGHDDGVGYDEWVAYEYAKVRRLYDRLGLGARTEIEYFNGPHTIHGVGTFDFLHRHLNRPKTP